MKDGCPIRKEDLKGIQMPNHTKVVLPPGRLMVQHSVFESVLLPLCAEMFNVSHFHC